MLVTDNAALVGDFDFDFCVVRQNNALTRQPRFDARIDGAVDKIFFFVRDFFQFVFAFQHKNVARAARANPTAIVVEVNVVKLGHFQNRNIAFCRHGFGRNIFIFKCKFNNCHKKKYDLLEKGYPPVSKPFFE